MSRKEIIEIEWFSVEEKLPVFNRKVLIKDKHFGVIIGYLTKDKWCSSFTSYTPYIFDHVIEWAHYPF